MNTVLLILILIAIIAVLLILWRLWQRVDRLQDTVNKVGTFVGEMWDDLKDE